MQRLRAFMDMTHIILRHFLDRFGPFIDRRPVPFDIHEIDLHFPRIDISALEIERVHLAARRIDMNSKHMRIRSVRRHDGMLAVAQRRRQRIAPCLHQLPLI